MKKSFHSILLVYVTVSFAVVFGINSSSNAGMNTVSVRGAAEHYYTFHTCIASTVNPNAVANYTVITWLLIAVVAVNKNG